MTRRQRRLSPEERSRARKVLVALAGAAGLVLALAFVAWIPWPGSGGHDGAEHEHLVAPHEGTLASLGEGEPHNHAEAVLGLGGSLTFYTLRPDARASRPVGRQVLTARVRGAGEKKSATVLLVPMPCTDDPPGTTSRFTGRLAEAFWGRDLFVTVPGLAVEGQEYRLEFAAVKSPADHAGHLAEQERLYLTPGGKYRPDDIKANGNTTAARKFEDHEVDHDLSPKEAGWLCPVSSARSDPSVTWTVSAQRYRFCCSPCIDEFVRLAKERPEQVKPPASYWKR